MSYHLLALQHQAHFEILTKTEGCT